MDMFLKRIRPIPATGTSEQPLTSSRFIELEATTVAWSRSRCGTAGETFYDETLLSGFHCPF